MHCSSLKRVNLRGLDACVRAANDCESLYAASGAASRRAKRPSLDEELLAAIPPSHPARQPAATRRPGDPARSHEGGGREDARRDPTREPGTGLLVEKARRERPDQQPEVADQPEQTELPAQLR